MATAAMQVAAHQMPPMSLPRIRPPRMLPGTPSPNTNPQPPGPVPSGKVWVQGQWRDPRSNAAKQLKEVQSRKIEKAIRHETHGMNIYVYSNLRTNQVVYSLTKNLDNTNVLRQLLYHGKKTVPAAVRRDMWRPYYSIHFSHTPTGAKAGLLAYHRLKELSMQRQLSPSEDLITTTQKDIDEIKARIGDPLVVAERMKEKRHDAKGDQRVKIPTLGYILPKKYRAKKLMDQKRFSVADVAYVIGMLRQKGSLAEQLEMNKEEWQKWYESKGYVGRKKVRAIQREVQAEKQKLLDQAAVAETDRRDQGRVVLDRQVATRLSMEYEIPVGSGNKIPVSTLSYDADQLCTALESRIKSEVKEAQELAIDQAKGKADQGTPEQIRARARETYMTASEADPDSAASRLQRLEQNSDTVKLLWADTRSALYAESWPENVEHGWMAPRAIATKTSMYIRPPATTDEEGYDIAYQKTLKPRFSSSSVHVMGSEQPYEGYSTHAAEIAQRAEKYREARFAQIEEAEMKEEERLKNIAREEELAEAKLLGTDVLGDPSGSSTGVDDAVPSQLSPPRKDYVEPRQKGVWDRVKGFFGR